MVETSLVDRVVQITSGDTVSIRTGEKIENGHIGTIRVVYVNGVGAVRILAEMNNGHRLVELFYSEFVLMGKA